MPHDAALEHQPQAQPHSLTALFLACNHIALQGLGGVLPIIQREIVERRAWMTQQEFVQDWAVAQILPGGNIINLCIIVGHRFFGWRGAVAALAGILTVPLLIALALASLYAHWVHVPAVAGAVRGMGAVAAGMIAASAIKMLAGLKHNILGAYACIALIAMTFIAVGLLRWPLMWVVLCLGLPAWAAAWVLVRRVQARDLADADAEAIAASAAGRSAASRTATQQKDA
jgi:chromate transporter